MNNLLHSASLGALYLAGQLVQTPLCTQAYKLEVFVQHTVVYQRLPHHPTNSFSYKLENPSLWKSLFVMCVIILYCYFSEVSWSEHI